MSNLTGMQYLDVSNNYLNGDLAVIANLTNLLQLQLDNNALCGDVATVANMTYLALLYLDNNRFQGTVDVFGRLTTLLFLSFASNQISGAVDELASLSSLVVFLASSNNLTGTLHGLSKLTRLINIDVSHNHLFGDLQPLALLTRLSILISTDNSFSGDINPLANLTVLEQLNLAQNSLHGDISMLSRCCTKLQLLFLNGNQLTGSLMMLSLLSSVQRVDVSDNRFLGSVLDLLATFSSHLQVAEISLASNALYEDDHRPLLIDWRALPATLVILNLSHNFALQGHQLLPYAHPPDHTVLFDASGISLPCPMPVRPPLLVSVFSQCVPEWDSTLKTLLVVAACVAVLFAVAWIRLNKLKWFVRVVAVSVWLFTVAVLVNDCNTLWTMIATVRSQFVGCDSVNHRTVFIAVVPHLDYVTGVESATQYYSHSSATQWVVDHVVTSNNSVGYFSDRPPYIQPDPPAADQTFVEFMQVFTVSVAQHIVPRSFLDEQRQAFGQLCGRLPQCQAHDDTCLPTFSGSTWVPTSQYPFLVCVVLLLSWKVTLEVIKLGLAVASVWQGDIIRRDWSLAVLQSSPCVPILGVIGVAWVDEVLAYTFTYQDRVRYFVWQGLCTQLPFLGLVFYYLQYVQQTGLTVLNSISLVVSLTLVTVGLLRALWTFCRQEQARATLVRQMVTAHHQRRDVEMLVADWTPVSLTRTERDQVDHDLADREDVESETDHDSSGSAYRPL